MIVPAGCSTIAALCMRSSGRRPDDPVDGYIRDYSNPGYASRRDSRAAPFRWNTKTAFISSMVRSESQQPELTTPSTCDRYHRQQ